MKKFSVQLPDIYLDKANKEDPVLILLTQGFNLTGNEKGNFTGDDDLIHIQTVDMSPTLLGAIFQLQAIAVRENRDNEFFSALDAAKQNDQELDLETGLRLIMASIDLSIGQDYPAIEVCTMYFDDEDNFSDMEHYRLVSPEIKKEELNNLQNAMRFTKEIVAA